MCILREQDFAFPQKYVFWSSFSSVWPCEITDSCVKFGDCDLVLVYMSPAQLCTFPQKNGTEEPESDRLS